MNRDEVNTLATILKKALSQGSPPIHLSKHACLNDSYSILCVAHSLRTACLLSTLIASTATLIALQNALSQLELQHLAVVVHVASEQIFIVNKHVFVERYNDANRVDLFYSVDADGRSEQERIRTSIPYFLDALLSSLSGQLKGKDGKEQGKVDVILLESEQGTSLQGVALAGWLLDYEFIYSFDLVDNGDKIVARSWTAQGSPLTGIEMERDSVQNALAGATLVLIEVKIDAQSTTLYQFTFPHSMTSAVATKLNLVDDNLLDICEAIKTRLANRSHQKTSELGFSFDVSHRQVTMNQVAL